MLTKAVMEKIRERGEALMKEFIGHVKTNYWRTLGYGERKSDYAIKKDILKILRKLMKERVIKRASVRPLEKKSGPEYLGYMLIKKRRKPKKKLLRVPKIQKPRGVWRPSDKALREKVVEPWLKQLPDVRVHGVFFKESKKKFYGNNKLPIETDNPLFDEFKRYICPDCGPNPFRLWYSLKRKTGTPYAGFWKKIRDFDKGISTFLGDMGRFQKSEWGPAELEELCMEYRKSEDHEKEHYLKKFTYTEKSPLSLLAKDILQEYRELTSLRKKLEDVLLKHLWRDKPFHER